MRRTILLMATMALTLLGASGLAQAAGVGSAAESSVVGPGESIQKAIYAAHPGDTIVVKGVHKEDVVIRKDGIQLRGDDAVIEAPPKSKADSPCSKAFGSTGFCVLGDIDFQTGKVRRYVEDVSISGFTVRGFKGTGIDVGGAREATVTKVRAINNGNGIGTSLSVGTRILSNVVRDSGEDGIGAQDSRDVTIAKNDVQDSSNSAFVTVSSTNVTIVGNDSTDSTLSGTLIRGSTGTKVLSNDISRSGLALAGAIVFENSADTKLVGNNISGGPFGIYVTDAHEGSFVGNDLRDNCAGMFFEAFKGEPVGGFTLSGNTVADNTRSCRAAQFDRNLSGVGIALLGASGMKVRANHFWGNAPSGPTRISGGVVVAVDPYFGGTTKPKNNSVIGNHFGRNKPDIFYDGSGTGNSFRANDCDTSVPSRLCN